MALSNIGNINHAAYRCRDAEQTRWFYEDVLNLPYTMALTEEHISGTDIPRPYMHLFFEMGDGNFIAFFDDPNTAHSEQFEHKDSFDYHLAFEIDNLEDLDKWKRKIKDARVKVAGPVNHGFIQSIYFYDPNGVPLEIAAKTPQYGEITGELANTSQEQLIKWTKKTRQQKIDLFGEEELDRREVSKFYDY